MKGSEYYTSGARALVMGSNDKTKTQGTKAMKLIKWFKELFYLIRNFRGLRGEIASLHERIRELTTVNVDVHYKSPHNVIMVGRYKNTDYVEVFSVRPDDFSHFIEMFRDWRKQGRIDRIDAPPQMKAVFEREKY